MPASFCLNLSLSFVYRIPWKTNSSKISSSLSNRVWITSSTKNNRAPRWYSTHYGTFAWPREDQKKGRSTKRLMASRAKAFWRAPDHRLDHSLDGVRAESKLRMHAHGLGRAECVCALWISRRTGPKKVWKWNPLPGRRQTRGAWFSTPPSTLQAELWSLSTAWSVQEVSQWY